MKRIGINALDIISLLLGFLGLVTGFYFYTHPKEPTSSFAIYQKTVFDVFNINQPIDSLKITLSGRDVRKDKLNITVFEYKIVNNGENDIEPNKYTLESPFGIKVSNSKIIGIRVVDSDDDYLKSNFKAKIQDSSFVKFEPILFSKGKSITCDLLVMHKDNDSPNPIFKGKIAGIIGEPKITLDDEPEKDFGKTIIYVILSVVVLIVVLFFVIALLDWGIPAFIKMCRKIAIKSSIGSLYAKGGNKYQAIVEIFSELGKKRFIEILNIIKNDEKMKIEYEKDEENEKIFNKFIELQNNKMVLYMNKMNNKIVETKFKTDLFITMSLLHKYGFVENRIVKKEFINEIEDVLKLIS